MPGFWINTTGGWWKPEDTALSIKLLHQHRSRHIAAIAGKLAAELYALEIAAPNIHTLKNYTVSWYWQPEERPGGGGQQGIDQFLHRSFPREAWRVLTRIAEAGINLSNCKAYPYRVPTSKYSFRGYGIDAAEQLNNVLKR